MSDHSVLPPSAAHEWLHCAGWLKMQPPETSDSPESSEGTLRHAEGAELLKLAAVGKLPTGVIHPALTEYVNLCHNIMRRTAVFGGDSFGIERKIPMPSIHPLAFGTCDFFIFKWPHLWVVDYKHGHRYVEVFDNPQLICYASGIMDMFKIDGKTDQELQIHMHIVGPNMYVPGGPVYSWDCKGSDLRGHVNRLRAAAETNIASGDCKAGSHCRDCKARLTCKAAIRSSVDTYLAVEQAAPYDLDSYAIGNYYGLLKAAAGKVKSMIDAIEPELLSRMRRGERIPGWTKREKQSALKWQMPDAEILQLSDLLELGLRLPAKPMTPTQAIKAGVDQSIIQQYAARESAGVEIVPEDTTLARRVFAND